MVLNCSIELRRDCKDALDERLCNCEQLSAFAFPILGWLPTERARSWRCGRSMRESLTDSRGRAATDPAIGEQARRSFCRKRGITFAPSGIAAIISRAAIPVTAARCQRQARRRGKKTAEGTLDAARLPLTNLPFAIGIWVAAAPVNRAGRRLRRTTAPEQQLAAASQVSFECVASVAL
jgi:hypothetical protein